MRVGFQVWCMSLTGFIYRGAVMSDEKVLLFLGPVPNLMFGFANTQCCSFRAVPHHWNLRFWRRMRKNICFPAEPQLPSPSLSSTPSTCLLITQHEWGMHRHNHSHRTHTNTHTQAHFLSSVIATSAEFYSLYHQECHRCHHHCRKHLQSRPYRNLPVQSWGGWGSCPGKQSTQLDIQIL